MKLRILLCVTLVLGVSAVVANTLEPPKTPEVYKIDGTHSVVIFGIKHLNVANFYGRFNDVSGNFVIDDKKPANSMVELSIKSASIDTNAGNRDKFLRSAQFFDTDKYPEITFKAKGFKKSGKSSYKVKGDLTLLGVSKSITIKVDKIGSGKDPWGGYRSGFETHFSIKRSEVELRSGCRAKSSNIWVSFAATIWLRGDEQDVGSGGVSSEGKGAWAKQRSTWTRQSLACRMEAAWVWVTVTAVWMRC